jgi:hypothetical protein
LALVTSNTPEYLEIAPAVSVVASTPLSEANDTNKHNIDRAYMSNFIITEKAAIDMACMNLTRPMTRENKRRRRNKIGGAVLMEFYLTYQ